MPPPWSAALAKSPVDPHPAGPGDDERSGTASLRAEVTPVLSSYVSGSWHFLPAGGYNQDRDLEARPCHPLAEPSYAVSWNLVPTCWWPRRAGGLNRASGP